MKNQKKTIKFNQEELLDVINFKQGVYKGYDYVVFYFERGVMGHLNGYVRIPESHPAYKLGTKWSWYDMGATARKMAKATRGKKNEFPQQYVKRGPLDKRHYRRKYEDTDLRAHGGLTFGNVIDEKNKDGWFLGILDIKPGFWVGWDYLHAGDEMYLPKDRIIEKPEYVQKMYAELMAIHNQFSGLPKDRRWEFDEVEVDCKDVIEQLIELEHGYPKCADCGKEINPENPDVMLCWDCLWKQEIKKKKNMKKTRNKQLND